MLSPFSPKTFQSNELFEGKNTKLMKDKKLEANLSMAVSKIFSGLNMNALKYLLPLWMSPLTGATLRCTFAAAAFWVIGWFMPPEKSSAKDKWLLFLLGAFGLYGFMFLYLAGLSKRLLYPVPYLPVCSLSGCF